MRAGTAAPLLVLCFAFAPSRTAAPDVAAPSAADLAGTWAGTLTHDGENQPVALTLEPDSLGKIRIALSLPVIYLDHAVLGSVAPHFEGDSVRLGPFRMRFASAAGTLSGTMPAGLVPWYALPLELHKTERFEMPQRLGLAAQAVDPAWVYDAGAAMWAGPAFADGVVYVGAQDGQVLALDAATGKKRWSFAAGGPIRTRPTVERGDLYVQADDGYLYKLATASGALRWRVKLVEGTIERLPFDDPRSRYDRFGSDVAIAGGRLYVGTHEGKVVALDPADGKRIWEFATGDAVLAAPAVAGGTVLSGSYDHFVYALAAADGHLIWKQDTHGAVVSTPAVAGKRAVIGNRCYDLLGLDLETGATAWKRYIWQSWVESSATIRDGVAYVGSSDAAALFAVDVATGKRVWTTDVFGWAWGQPAVTKNRVYLGTSSQVGYVVKHVGALLALDRASGHAVWRYALAAPDSGAYGIPGSPALGAGRVYASGLDGKVYAFPQ